MLAACRAWTIARVQAEPAAQRTPEQAAKLKSIATVLKIPESSVPGYINYSTFTFRDITQKNGGVSPFGNDGVRYVGSADDAALNAAVPRFKADATVAARLVQTFVDSSEHSYWGDAFYSPLFDALLQWVEQGQKPSPASVAERCRQLRPAQPGDCRFLPDHVPKALATRVLPR